MAEPFDTGPMPDSQDDQSLLRKLRRWFRADAEHSRDWREEAVEDYAFTAGDQWAADDVAKLKEQLRPVITFSRIDPVIRSVVGEQINNAQEVRYYPREAGDAHVSDLFTQAAGYFRDQCDADDEESDGFWDCCVAGMGWIDTRLDFEEDPDEPTALIERIDPLEMFWDCNARKRNLADARRIWRVRDMPVDVAESMFPDAAETDLHAGWADLGTPGHISSDEPGREYEGNGQPERNPDRTVTIVQVQWMETQPSYQTVNPISGETVEFDMSRYRRLSKRLKALGLPVRKIERRVYRQAFIGRTFLREPKDLKCPHFTFTCITGFRDRNEGTWYGLVRAMKDPQRWANKWLSQTLHIMNSSAKGGVMVEEGALGGKTAEFERSFNKQDQVTFVPDGMLSTGKVQPKPVAQFPQGFYQLMEFAISSVRDVTGVNLEMLGMREGNQPASLEYQRRQAGITILAQLFRSMKRYHRMQGRVLLYYIQNFLSDGRLVKIVGESGAQYVPLMRQADAKYDIVVDEGPTSPNQKERVWQLIGDRFWTLPPQIQLVLLDYSPFPESVVEKIKQAATAASQGPQAEMQQQLEALELQMKQLLVQHEQAKIGKTQSEAQENFAQAQRAGMPAPGAPDGGQGAFIADMQATQARTAVDREKIVTQANVEMAKATTAAQVEMAKEASRAQVSREKTEADIATNLAWMEADAERDMRKAAITEIGKMGKPDSGPRQVQ